MQQGCYLLNGVGDVGHNLHCLAEVITPALTLNHLWEKTVMLQRVYEDGTRV
jgi:hypothetical protein